MLQKIVFSLQKTENDGTMGYGIMAYMKKAWTYLVIAAVAFAAALNYEIFVFPNQFAPAGLNGICTMIQYVTGISVGYLSLLINIPLALMVFFYVSKPIAIRSMLYVVTFSVSLLILDKVDLSPIAYSTPSSTILGPLVAGIIMGFIYNILVNASAYTGGTDFVSAMIHKNHPEKSVYGLTFTLNVVVAISSFFVYNYKMEPVILCIIYNFATTTLGQHFMKNGRSAIRFEIVTDYPTEICNDIISRMHHSATMFKASGAYTGKDTWIVMCVVNTTQASKLTNIIKAYPNTFAMMSPVNGVMGNFKKYSGDGKKVVSLLDKGDGKTV